MKEDWNAPREGQAAAIVAIAKSGPYLARFPYMTAGGRAEAQAAAEEWIRSEGRPRAQVFHFTGRIVHRLVWEDEAHG